MKKFLALLLCLIVCSAGQAETYKCTVPQGETANVRLSPSKKARTEGKRIFSGDKIEGRYTDDKLWIQFVDSEGDTVYVMSKYMELVAELECTVIGNGRLRWRKSPNGKVGGYYSPGDTVTVYGIVTDAGGTLWGRIAPSKWAIGGRYVSLQYLADQGGNVLSDIYD